MIILTDCYTGKCNTAAKCNNTVIIFSQIDHVQNKKSNKVVFKQIVMKTGRKCYNAAK